MASMTSAAVRSPLMNPWTPESHASATSGTVTVSSQIDIEVADWSTSMLSRSCSVELASLILEEAEVALVPGEAFGTPGYFRLSYALGDDDLVEGVSRVAKLLSEAS